VAAAAGIYDKIFIDDDFYDVAVMAMEMAISIKAT